MERVSLVQTDSPPTHSGVVVDAGQPQTVQTVKAAVLFADLRGYTALAERIAPADVLLRLRQLFDVLFSAVDNHGGQVFHVAGDNLMAGFAVHRQGQDGGWAALTCGQAMLSQFAALGEQWQRELGIATTLGVGVHFGDVAVGLLGPPGHEAPTLIGDTVNVAARLCGRARGGELLFSAAVLDNVHSSVHQGACSAWLGCESAIGVTPVPLPYRRLSPFSLRGRQAPVDIWCLPATERVRM